MTTTPTFTARPYAGDADLLPIGTLINTSATVDGLDEQHSKDDLRRLLEDPLRDRQQDIRLWIDPAGQVAGFGLAFVPPPGDAVLAGEIYFAIRPAARHQGLESAIITWGAERMRAVGRARGVPARLYCGARAHYAYGRAVLEQHGLRPARYFYQMARPLSAPIPDPAFPAGYTLRHVAGDTDVERWVDCYNAAFIDHWQFTPRTVTRRRQQMAAPDYRPDLDLVLQAPDGTFAAFCWCTVNAEEPAEATQRDGWIVTLGTRRSERGRGLGRALLLTGLQRLQALGLDTALLHVDAENPTGALRLYEGAGFAAVETDIMHAKDL